MAFNTPSHQRQFISPTPIIKICIICIMGFLSFGNANAQCSGTALNFDGSKKSASITATSGDALSLNNYNFTVSVWLYALDNTKLQNILFHGQGCQRWASWFLGIGGGESNDNPGKLVFGFRSADAAAVNKVVSPSNVMLNTWFNVSIVYDGASLIMYINGMAVKTETYTSPYPGPPYNTADYLYLGKDPGCGGRNFFNGKMDDLQVFSSSNGANSISQWYNRVLTSDHPNYSSLQAYFKFNEGSGTAITSSKNNWTGFIDPTLWTTSGTALALNNSISSISVPVNPICSDATTTLTANGVTGDNIKVTWWTGPGGTGINKGTGNTLSNAGVGTYYARVTGECATAAERSITISAVTNAGNVSGPNCFGQSALYISSTPGGVWSSSNPEVATIDAITGVASAVSSGTVNFIYTIGCSTTFSTEAAATVDKVFPGTISGKEINCSGYDYYSSSGTIGGIWRSDNRDIIINENTGNAIIDYNARHYNVYGRITYTVTNSCGETFSTSKSVKYVASLDAGHLNSYYYEPCPGATITIARTGNYNSGGTWSTSDPAVAQIVSSSDQGATVKAMAGGTATITYTVGNQCGTSSSSTTVTINNNPNAGLISGMEINCNGSDYYSSSGTKGGIWRSDNRDIIINENTGNAYRDYYARHSDVYGTITYTVTNNCGETFSTSKSVKYVASLDAGQLNSYYYEPCPGATITIARTGNYNSGSTWNTSNPAVAQIVSSSDQSATVKAMAGGTATITYTVGNQCGTSSSSTTITINNTSNAGTISGPSTICIGSSVSFNSSGTANGTWSVVDTAIASINIYTGKVLGIKSGTTNIVYKVFDECSGNYYTTQASIVVHEPNVITSISAAANPICTGITTTLTANGVSGVNPVVTWYTGPNATGTNKGTGLSLTNVGAGTYYARVTGDCGMPIEQQITINSITPPVATFTANNNLCQGSPITFNGPVQACSGNAINGGAGISNSFPVTAINNLTMEAWVKWNGSTGGTQIILLNGNTGTNGYALIIRPIGNILSILCGGVNYADAATSLTPGKWQHVVVVRSAGIWTLYLDGVAYSLTNNTITPNPINSGGFFTGSNHVSGERFNGLIDEVRVWDRALTFEEIKANRITCITTPQTNLKGYWQFNETTGTSAADVSGNNLSLTLNAGALRPVAATFTWSFAGVAGTGINPSYTFSTGGPKTVSLTVEDLLCSATSSQNLFLKAPVGLSSVSAGSGSLCPGSITTLTANGITGDTTSVNWYSAPNGGGIHYGRGITLTGRTAGTYYTRVTGECANPVEANITITSKTSVAITYVTAQANPVCFNATTTLTANGVAGTNSIVTWWTGPNGTGTNKGTGAILNNASPGTYYARVTGDCGSPVETSIIISALPAYYRSITSGNWNAPTTWQSSCDNINWVGATATPDNSSNTITIQNGHTVTITENVTTDQTIVQPLGAIAVANGKTLTVANNGLLLQSSVLGTARIANSTGGTITGNVTVERYIPMGKRAYRQLAPGVNSADNIFTNWQNGGLNTPGKGMLITGSKTGANGFDATASGNASVFTFIPGAPVYTPLAGTNGSNKLKALQGYRVFVIGDRNANLTILNNTGIGTPNIALNNATTLSATGTIITGPVSYNNSGATALGITDNSIKLGALAGQYALIANPYWSPVDFDLVSKNDILPTYWIWDPTIGNRGAYTSYSSSTGLSSGGAITKHIQPGQSIFIQNTTTGFSGNPSITFNENNKTSAFTNTLRGTGQKPATLLVKLYENKALLNGLNMQDGATIAFKEDYSIAVTDEDAPKFTNSDENIAIVEGNHILGVNAKPLVQETDTIPLRIWKLFDENQYTLQIKGADFEPGIMAFLNDKHLKQVHPIQMEGITDYSFKFKNTDSTTWYNRFEIILNAPKVLPLSFTSIKAQPQNKGVQVAWKVTAEININRYEIERSADGQTFVSIGSVKATGNSNSDITYNWFDEKPGDVNFYRIKSFDKSGTIKYSEVVKVLLNNSPVKIQVYPNPVMGNRFVLKYNNVPKGKYTLQLFNNSGVMVFTKQINASGAASNETIRLMKRLPAGVYTVVLTDELNAIYQQKIIFEN